MLISEEYRALNKELHESRVDYGVSGAKWAQRISELATVLDAKTILDYGCGKGTLGMALSQWMVIGYDPAVPGREERPEPADLVVCGDVLEHIEPECLDEVLDDLKSLTLKGIFLTVCTVPALKVLPDGRNAHLIQKPCEWWLPKIMDRWALRLFNATVTEFAAFAIPYEHLPNGQEH